MLHFNSLTPGRCENSFKIVIVKLVLRIESLSFSYDIALQRMP